MIRRRIPASPVLDGPVRAPGGVTGGAATTDIGFTTPGRIEANSSQSTGRVLAGPMAADTSYGGFSVGQSSLAFATAMYFSNGTTTVFNGPSGSTMHFRIANGDSQLAINDTQGVKFDSTDASGTPGAATINKPRGLVSIASGVSSVVVTNSKVTASSGVFAVLQDNTDAVQIRSVVPAAGSFTINLTGNTTAARKCCFIVVNP